MDPEADPPPAPTRSTVGTWAAPRPPLTPTPSSTEATTPVSLRQSWNTPGLKNRAQALANWWFNTRIARALARYGVRYGGLLSSGMALTTILSLTAALTVGWSIFVSVVGRDTALRDAVIATVNSALPGLLTTPEAPGLIDPADLLLGHFGSVTSIVALLIMVWSSMSVVGQLGSSIRAMFGLTATPENVIITYARRAAGAIGLGVALLGAAGLTMAMDLFGDWLLDLLGIAPGAGQAVLSIATRVGAFAVDAAVTAFLITVVAGVRAPTVDLVWGASLMALASMVLRTLGTTAVGSVSGPLLTTATSVITLVLWINLQVRVLLTICAWMANPPRPVKVTDARDVHFLERPNYVTLSVPATLNWPHNELSGEVQPAPLGGAESGTLGSGAPHRRAGRGLGVGASTRGVRANRPPRAR